MFRRPRHSAALLHSAVSLGIPSYAEVRLRAGRLLGWRPELNRFGTRDDAGTCGLQRVEFAAR
jgi:hypothetical protein